MSTHTRTLLLSTLVISLFGSLSLSVLAQAQTTSGTVALDAEGTVAVDNHEGEITVNTWDRAEVRYEAVVQPENGADNPEATVVRVEEGTERFQIRTEYDESKADNDSGWFGSDNQNLMPVAYTLTVPRSARLEIDDHESEMRVQGLDGPVGIDTHEGSITLTDNTGATEIDSHEGPITIEEHSGRLTIDAHDSRIRLASVAGPTDIETHEGQIEAEDLRGALSIDTHDGDADLRFAELTGDVRIETHDGDFVLALPSKVGFALRTDFGDGVDLRSDVDLTSLQIGTDDDDPNYAGSVNGGGPLLSFTAHDGAFEIRIP